MFINEVSCFNHIELRGDSIDKVISRIVDTNVVVHINEAALADGDFSDFKKMKVFDTESIMDTIKILIAKCSKPEEAVCLHRNFHDCVVITYGVETGAVLSSDGYCKGVCRNGKLIGYSKTR